MPVIDIRLHKGMYPNADPEDIKPEFANDLINFIPKDTRLVKAIGSGPYMGNEPFEPAGTKAFTNMFDFISSKLNMTGIVGHINIFNVIATATGLLGLYGLYDSDTFNPLVSMSQFTSGQGVYLAYESGYRHPMIVAGNVMRIICGKDDYIGTNLLTNAWIGWIDRKQFNEQRTIAPAFYIYKAPLPVAPIAGDFTWSISSQVIDREATHENPTVYYYKYSMVYDYNQDGLLSELIGTQELYDDEGAVITLFLEELDTYRRLTAIKLYRSINREADYELISISNTVADSDETLTGTDASCMVKFFFNNADVGAYDFIGGSTEYSLRITVDTGAGNQDSFYVTQMRINETGEGNKIITMQDPSSMMAGWSSTYGEHQYPIVAWELIEDPTGTNVQIASASDGSELQFDTNVLTFSNANANKIKVGDLVKIIGGTVVGTLYMQVNKIINSGNDCSIGFTENIISSGANYFSGKTFYIFVDGKTNAVVGYSAGGATIDFLDLRQASTSPHPLDGEVSIQVNSKYGRYNSGRMWQVNSILDPAGVAEEQVTLLMYSEYNQPDVMPVSNAIQLYDKMGGDTLGIEILYDFVIVIKEHTLFMVNPIIENDPSTWTVSESPHGIGCVSDIGHVVANGSLYIIYYDGIYEFTPNNLAESDSTPLERLKITDPIEDIFLALTDVQKEALRIYHDKIRNEIIIYSMTFNSSGSAMCFNLFDRSWRRMSYGSEDPTLFLHNGESHLILFDDGSAGFLDINAESGNSVIVPTYRTLDFTIGVDKYEILRHFEITYKSAETLAFKIYDAETNTELFTYTLPVKSSAAGTEKIGVRERARKMYIKITGASTTNAVEIHRLVLVPENSSE